MYASIIGKIQYKEHQNFRKSNGTDVSFTLAKQTNEKKKKTLQKTSYSNLYANA